MEATYEQWSTGSKIAGSHRESTGHNTHSPSHSPDWVCDDCGWKLDTASINTYDWKAVHELHMAAYDEVE